MTIGGFPWRCFDTWCETHAECLMYGCNKLVEVKEVDTSKAALPVNDGDVLLIAPRVDYGEKKRVRKS